MSGISELGRTEIVFLLALGLAGAATPLLIRYGRRGFLLDRPNLRSSHVRPTPRGGGLAIVLSWAVVVGIFGSGDVRMEVVAAGALTMAALGFLDDVFSLPILPRLISQVVIASAVAILAGPIDAIAMPSVLRMNMGAFAGIGTVIWLVAVTNFFNFMDGIDGLAAGQAALSAWVVIGAGWSGQASLLAAAAGGAALGFLPYNWSPARIFMGDVGSMAIGFLLASLPLLAEPARRPDAAFATAIGLALFLLDPTVTLIRKVTRGERIGQSHRDHTYQQFVRAGELHGRTTGLLLLATAPLAILAAWVFRDPRLGPVAAGAAIAVYVAEVLLAGRRSDRMTQN